MAKSAKKRASRSKSKAKRNAKAKKPATAKTKEETRSKIGIEFNVRSGTNREKLLEVLHKNFKKQVSKRDLMKAVYGKENPAINMVMGGIRWMIDKDKLPYKVISDRNEQKETTFGLHPK